MSLNFQQIWNQYPIADFTSHSRVHAFKYLTNSQLTCYIKRDDELSCAIAGSKMRKYSSIIPFLKRNEIEEAVVIGGLNSNHVMGLTQLLIENSIKPTLFLCRPHLNSLKGNAKLLDLLVPKENIQWIERSQWPSVEKLASEYTTDHSPKKIQVIPEGGRMFEALPGALTLPHDILHNEKALNLQFDHLFMDSGTGMTAIGLILGLAYANHPGHVHVIQMADNASKFLDHLQHYHALFMEKFRIHYPTPTQFSLHQPLSFKSFGSTGPKIFELITSLARSDGVLCDPIYNAKLVMEAQQIIQNKQLTGQALLIHSGGTLSLLGFL